MKTIFKVFGAFVATLIVTSVILALVTDDEEIADAEPTNAQAKVSKLVKEELTVDKKVENAIIDAIGESNNSKNKTVDSIAYVGEDKSAVVVLNANENLTTNLTKKGIWLNSKEIFEEVKNIEEVESYTFYWNLPLVDTYGNEEAGLVMSFDIQKEDLQKINYDNFLTDNVPNVVGNYFEHTGFNE